MTQEHSLATRRPLLAAAFPELAKEIIRLLEKMNEPALAAEVPSLRIVGRCRCGDSFCATIYTQPAPKGSYPTTVRTLDLDAHSGMIIVDIVDGRIAEVEILYRDDIRQALLQVMP